MWFLGLGVCWGGGGFHADSEEKTSTLVLGGWFCCTAEKWKRGGLMIWCTGVGGVSHTNGLRPNDTGRAREQMGPVDVNGGVHIVRKQHQRNNVPICMCIASCVDWA